MVLRFRAVFLHEVLSFGSSSSIFSSANSGNISGQFGPVAVVFSPSLPVAQNSQHSTSFNLISMISLPVHAILMIISRRQVKTAVSLETGKMAEVSVKVTLPDKSTKAIRISPEKLVSELITEVLSKMKEELVGTEAMGLFQAGNKGRGSRWLLPNRTLKFYGITSSGVRLGKSYSFSLNRITGRERSFCPSASLFLQFWFYWENFCLWRSSPLQSELEYKKKHRIMKIQLMDDSVKSVLIDASGSVKNIIQVSSFGGIPWRFTRAYVLFPQTIGEKLELRSSDEYGVKLLDSTDGSHPSLLRSRSWTDRDLFLQANG